MSTLKNTWLRRLFRLRSWLGLLTGMPLLLGLSGAALVFRPELDRLLVPPAAAAPAGRAPVSLDAVQRRLGHRYPALHRMVVRHLPQQPGDSYEFRLCGNDGDPSTYDLINVNVEPGTGRILREGAYAGLAGGCLNWLYQFHFSFQLGLWGVVPTRLRLPTQPGKPFSVSGPRPSHELPWGPSAMVEVDPSTGRVLATRDTRTATWPARWEALAGPLHLSTFGGWPTRVLCVVVGLTPGLLALTGFALWYRRQPRRAPGPGFLLFFSRRTRGVSPSCLASFCV